MSGESAALWVFSDAWWVFVDAPWVTALEGEGVEVGVGWLPW